MVTKIIDGRIVNGCIVHGECLEPFEGFQLQIVIPVSEKKLREEPDPAEGMDVEKDVWVKMPFQEVKKPIAMFIKDGDLRPCVVFLE